MNEEYGLFIVWENARKKEKEIIDDIKTRFELMNIFEVEWTKEIFSKNLTRFYGENLPKNSSKEKHVGNGLFLLIIVKDNNPIYGYRNTSKGAKYLNVNFFDSKSMYRSWTGKHMVHGTNDMVEFKHDLMMLLGENVDDYLKKYKKSDLIINFKHDVIGNDGWSSLSEIFYVLNETIPYVVLRNFDELPNKYEVGIHSDIDLLCDNRDNMAKIINAVPAKVSKKRSRYRVNVNDNYVYMDFRFVGDDYYCFEWEKNILSSRVLNKCFYIPDSINYKYSLLYHALVQKGKIASDYLEKFKKIFKTVDKNVLIKKLNDFLVNHSYKYVDPIDYSVAFNYSITHKRKRLSKIFITSFFRVYYKIKRVLKHEK